MLKRDDLEPSLLASQLKVADTIGSLMEFWGFKRSVGRLWTMLYLSPSPLGANDLGERLSMSAGSVSMTLAELTRWGAVHKTWVPGERREYFTVESSVWKLLTRVLREREHTLLHDASQTLATAQSALHQMLDSADSAQARHLHFVLDRIQRLSLLAALVETAIDAIIAGETIDPTSMREVATLMREEED